MISNELDIISYWVPGGKGKVNFSFFFKDDTQQVGALVFEKWWKKHSLRWEKPANNSSPQLLSGEYLTIDRTAGLLLVSAWWIYWSSSTKYKKSHEKRNTY